MWGVLLKKKMVVLLMFIVTFFAGFLLIFYVYPDSEDTEKLGIAENMPELTGPDTNTISYGLYRNDKLIDGHELYSLEGEKSLDFTYSLSNFIIESREFMLVVLIDFEQIPFDIGGTRKLSYTFSVDSNKTKNIPISFEVPENAKELTVLAFKYPGKVEKSIKNIERITSIQDVLPLRYNLKKEQKTISKLPSMSSIDDLVSHTPNENIFVSRSKSDLKITVNQSVDDPLYLHLGTFDEEYQTAILAFKDGKQVPLNGQKINVTTVSKTMEVYDLDTFEKGVYQVLSFPKPYQVTSDDYTSQEVHSSFRVNLY
jgi:hypothetical protein